MKKTIGVTALAALAFAFAFKVGSSVGGQTSAQEDIVMPASRSAERPDANEKPQAAALQAVDAPERFSASVTRNPFGALNMDAEAADAGQDAAPAIAIAPTPAASAKQAALPAPPPPAPMAPPLPFTAVGAIQGEQVTDGKLVAFIRQQDKLLLVRAGEAIGNAYKVESITPQRIEFTYVPLMQRQFLNLAP